MDGIEQEGVGVDLYELADILLDMGLYQAVVRGKEGERDNYVAHVKQPIHVSSGAQPLPTTKLPRVW